jgi:hypothetical protein
MTSWFVGRRSYRNMFEYEGRWQLASQPRDVRKLFVRRLAVEACLKKSPKPSTIDDSARPPSQTAAHQFRLQSASLGSGTLSRACPSFARTPQCKFRSPPAGPKTAMQPPQPGWTPRTVSAVALPRQVPLPSLSCQLVDVQTVHQSNPKIQEGPKPGGLHVQSSGCLFGLPAGKGKSL